MTAKPRVLHLALFLSDGEEIQPFLDNVQRLSHGTLRIEVHGNWRSGEPDFERRLIGDVRAGKADLGAVGSRAWDGDDRAMMRALGAPLLVDSYALQERVLRSPLAARMLADVRHDDVQGIGLLPGPLRIPIAVPHPLTGPASYRGLRIAVQFSRTAVDTMRTLGATPVERPAQPSLAGLDASEEQLYVIYGARHDKIARHLTVNVVLWPRTLVIFAGGGVTADQRAILRQAAAQAVAPIAEALAKRDRDDAETLCRRGADFVTVTDVERTALRQALQPVYDRLERDPATADAIAQIATMHGPGGPAAPARCAAPAPAAARTTPLDGVWRMHTRIGDDPNDPEPVAENYGDQILVFRRGRFAQTQEDRAACTKRWGTFTLRGSRITRNTTGGGGIAPNGVRAQPGELFVDRWSVYRDGLSLTALDDTGRGPETWHRAGPTPHFPRRCAPPPEALAG